MQCALSLPRSQPVSASAPVRYALCLFWGAGLQLRPSRQMSTIQNVRKSLVRNWKPVCSLVGDAISGAAFVPFPSTLPPASGRGWAGLLPARSSLEFLSPSRSVNGPAVSSVRVFLWLIFPLSLAILQFKLLSHVSSLRLPSGHSGPVLTLSNAACSSPFSPHLLVAGVGVWGTFLLGVAFSHVICGFYLFFLPVRLPSKIRKLPPDPPVRGSSGVWKLPIKTPFPGRVSTPNFCLSFYLLYLCPTSF